MSTTRTDGDSDAPLLDIWLVEDNDLFRDGVASLVGGAQGMRCGLSVRSCEEAISALEKLEPPDIVLMDIGLPGASGIEGTRQFRELAPATRVLMLTVHEEDVKVFEAIRAGASGYLLKPTPAAEILDALRQVSRGGRRSMVRSHAACWRCWLRVHRNDLMVTPCD